jgi:hypothetical protein
MTFINQSGSDQPPWNDTNYNLIKRLTQVTKR